MVSCASHLRCTCAARILSLFPCLYIEPFELVIEIVFHYCTTPPCNKINLFKRPFQGSRFERLDDALVLLISLIFLYPQKFSFLSDDRLDSRMYSVLQLTSDCCLILASHLATGLITAIAIISHLL